MQALSTESLDGFFDAHVQKLQEKGVFRTYDQPKGEALEGVHPFAKINHDEDSDFPIGTVRHEGDVPYDKAISSNHPMSCAFVPVDQAMVNLKTKSIQDAIADYVPPSSFIAYLRYFAENLDKPEIQSYLLASLENMKVQLTLGDIKKELSAEALEALLSHKTTKARVQDPEIQEALKGGASAFSFEDGSLNLIRSLRMANNLNWTVYRKESPKHPELLLTMAIFQGAHIGYKAELEKSIHRQHEAGMLPDEEHKNGIAVIKGALVQFEDFILFSSLVPIVLHEHAKLQKDGESARHTPEGMRYAITRGGERFLDARVLNSVTSIAPTQGGTPEEFEAGRLNMVCPAQRHLAVMFKAGVPEMLYDSVQQHKDRLKPHLNYTGKAARLACKGKFPENSPFSVAPFPQTPQEASYVSAEWKLGEGYFTQEEANALIPAIKKLDYAVNLPQKLSEAYDRYSRFRWNTTQFTKGLTIEPAPVAGKTGYIVAAHGFETVDTSFINIRQACELVEEQLKKLPEGKANRLRRQFRNALPERTRDLMIAPGSKFAHVETTTGAVPAKDAPVKDSPDKGRGR